jgi:drug/metabolite transporter (DMT)-like permease
MQTDNPRGIAAMCAAMAVFVVNDALMKYSIETLPVAQSVFVRGVLVTTLLLIVAGAQGKLRYWRMLFHPAVLARGALETAGSFTYIAALAYIPLAIALAISMVTPLVVLPFAVLLLAETVGWRRWSALVVGFVGVVLIVQPGTDGINWWAVLAFASTFAFALRDVNTRRIPIAIPSLLVTAASAAFIGLCAGGIMLVQGWQPMELRHVAALAGAAVLVGIGMHLQVIATRIAEATVVAGFRYTSLLWGVIIGYLVWGDLPGTLAWSGIALLVGAGLYATHRERVRHRMAMGK